MKKTMILLGAALMAGHVFAGVGATTNWVAKYVAQYVANAISNSPAELVTKSSAVTSNGVTSISVGSGDYILTASWEDKTELALTATNCTAAATAAGITNGVKWAVTTSGGFKSKYAPIITRTPTNYVCAAFSTQDATPSPFLSGTNVIFETSLSYVTLSQAKTIKGE